jgi:hypothetical protein
VRFAFTSPASSFVKFLTSIFRYGHSCILALAATNFTLLEEPLGSYGNTEKLPRARATGHSRPCALRRPESSILGRGVFWKEALRACKTRHCISSAQCSSSCERDLLHLFRAAGILRFVDSDQRLDQLQFEHELTTEPPALMQADS